jgi:hypothetical protein
VRDHPPWRPAVARRKQIHSMVPGWRGTLALTCTHRVTSVAARRMLLKRCARLDTYRAANPTAGERWLPQGTRWGHCNTLWAKGQTLEQRINGVKRIGIGSTCPIRTIVGGRTIAQDRATCGTLGCATSPPSRKGGKGHTPCKEYDRWTLPALQARGAAARGAMAAPLQLFSRQTSWALTPPQIIL